MNLHSAPFVQEDGANLERTQEKLIELHCQPNQVEEFHLNLWEVPERYPPPASPARDSSHDPDFFHGLVN
jgi:hypothetical protein